MPKAPNFDRMYPKLRRIAWLRIRLFSCIRAYISHSAHLEWVVLHFPGLLAIGVARSVKF